MTVLWVTFSFNEINGGLDFGFSNLTNKTRNFSVQIYY